MSYDLTIWKWAANATATADEIFQAIGKDEAHPAMQRFDVKKFVEAVHAEFGGQQLWTANDDEIAPPFSLDVADFTGTPANWITVNMSYNRLDEFVPKLIALCHRHGLVAFDHQTEEFNGG